MSIMMSKIFKFVDSFVTQKSKDVGSEALFFFQTK